VPHAPLVKLPVVGLPRQVTVQSMPALATSLDGIVLRLNFEPTDSAMAGAVKPLALVIEIGPALTPEVVPLPQPTIVRLKKVTPAQAHR
jgi:hypothetical protein